MKLKLRTMIIGLCTLLFSLGMMGGLALAANPAYSGVQCSGAAAKSPVCHASATDPLTGSNGVIVKAANIIALIAGIAAVIIIIIAGINFILSSGDSAKTGRAREAIIYAAVGLAVIVLSRAIITFIVSRV
jgi:hypothetical protein